MARFRGSRASAAKINTEQPKPVDRTSRLVIAEGAIGAGVAAITAITEFNRLGESKRALEVARKKNKHTDAPFRAESHKALLGSGPEAEAAYNYILSHGGAAVGDLEWLALREVFESNRLPFSKDYVDPSRPELVTEALESVAFRNIEISLDLELWKAVRKQISTSEIRNGDEAETHLKEHVNEAVRITSSIQELDDRSNNVGANSLLAGIATSGSLIFITLIALLIRKFRMRERRPKEKVNEIPPNLQEPREVKGGVVQPAKPAPKVKIQQKLQPPRRDEKRRPRAVTFEDELEHAKERLARVLGAATAEDITKHIDTQSKVGADILNEVLKSRHRRMEVEGLDKVLERVIRNEKAKDQKDEPAVEEIPVEEPRLKKYKHPMRLERREGLRPREFAALLREYGFGIGEKDGNGHVQVTYNGESIRNREGRVVVFSFGSSSKPISRGVAKQVIDDCVEFLEALETSGIQRPQNGI